MFSEGDLRKLKVVQEFAHAHPFDYSTLVEISQGKRSPISTNPAYVATLDKFSVTYSTEYQLPGLMRHITITTPVHTVPLGCATLLVENEEVNQFLEVFGFRHRVRSLENPNPCVTAATWIDGRFPSLHFLELVFVSDFAYAVRTLSEPHVLPASGGGVLH